MLTLFSFLIKSLTLQEDGSHRGRGDDSNFSALNEEDFQTVTIENNLGCDIYLKKPDQNTNAVGLLRHEDSTSLWIPPPRYSDRLNVADETREARRFVAVQIIEAKVKILLKCLVEIVIITFEREI